MNLSLLVSSLSFSHSLFPQWSMERTFRGSHHEREWQNCSTGAEPVQPRHKSLSLIEICKDSIIYQINRELRLLVDLETFISIINLVDWRFIFLSEENCEKVCLTGSGLFIGVQENWQVSLLIRNWWMRFHVKFSKEKFHVATFIHESRFKVWPGLLSE